MPREKPVEEKRKVESGDNVRHSLVDMFTHKDSHVKEKKEIEITEPLLRSRIEKSFQAIKSVNMDMVHQKNPELKVAKIYNVFPNIDYLGLE